jgi:murein DD-endopeptidase MepM/ murein hydrolase activator NlpD
MRLRKGLFLVALICVSVVAASGSPPPDPSVEDLMKQQEEMESKKKEKKEQIEQTRKAYAEKVRQQNAKERELETRKKHVRQLEQKLAAYEIQMNYIGSLIPETAESLGNLREIARKRIRELYKEGTKPYVAYLLESRSDVDFVDRVFYARLLIAHDYETFSRLKGTYNRLQTLSQKYDELARSTVALKGRVESEAAALRAEIKKFEAEKKKLLADERALWQAYEEFDKAIRDLGDQIRRRSGASPRTTPFDGVFLWPVRGRISSGFGMRRHPILKRRRHHSGMDFALPRGSIVSASASGTVILAGYKEGYEGYGNLVVILHGDFRGKSYTTLYGHLDEVLVDEDSELEAGDPIGKIGCTGLCTGPHLHFEIRVNGDPVDPAKYLH